jgi:hypothetical protein
VPVQEDDRPPGSALLDVEVTAVRHRDGVHAVGGEREVVVHLGIDGAVER